MIFPNILQRVFDFVVLFVFSSIFKRNTACPSCRQRLGIPTLLFFEMRENEQIRYLSEVVENMCTEVRI